MPGFDRTGPRGEGPRTGWGQGKCGKASRQTADYERGYEEPVTGSGYPLGGPGGGRGLGPGRGRGGGRGRGRGRGGGFGRGW